VAFIQMFMKSISKEEKCIRNKKAYQAALLKHPDFTKRIYQKSLSNPKRSESISNWRKKNRLKVAITNRKAVSKHQKKDWASISDNYCIGKILYKNTDPNITRKYLKENYHLIEIKRAEIILYRIKKYGNKQ